jgi:site-specific DNA-methyltransferase (adenine-specific)
MLEDRIVTLGPSVPGRMRGYAWMQDATARSRMPKKYKPAKLIFTSPPYLGVMKYAKLNWLRMWLIGKSPPEIDACLFSSSSLDKYLVFMTQVLTKLQEPLATDGRVCLVIGDVNKGDQEINLAEAVADSCAQAAGMNVNAIINDELPIRHKVSRIWKDRRGRATRIDRVLILSRGKRSRLPRVPEIDWSHLSSKGRRSVG